MSGTPNFGDTRVSASTEQPNSWDQGWYIFENGQVAGPLSAGEAFSAETSPNSGQVRMVSRKGFTQWYPVRDFAEIYAMIGNYSDQLSRAKSSPAPASGELSPKGRLVGPAAVTTTANKIVEVDHVQAAQNELIAAASNTNHQAQAENKSSSGSVRTPTIARGGGAEFTPAPNINAQASKKAIERQIRAARAAAKSQKLMDPSLFAQQYFTVQGRMRLGRVTSPVLGAFVFTPLTLGGYWWDWFARSSEEVAWHINGSTKINFVLPVWACMIPGLHLVLAYFLARMVAQMESENGYKSVDPVVATVAAVFPPFYIAMIQSALNRHWRLHVYHSAIPK